MTYSEFLRKLALMVEEHYHSGGLCLFLDREDVDALDEAAHVETLRYRIEEELGKGYYAYLTAAWCRGRSVKPSWMDGGVYNTMMGRGYDGAYTMAKRQARVQWLNYLAACAAASETR